eukprot:6203333-Pleurochrysis_carterae.AAC.4
MASATSCRLAWRSAGLASAVLLTECSSRAGSAPASFLRYTASILHHAPPMLCCGAPHRAWASHDAAWARPQEVAQPAGSVTTVRATRSRVAA